MSSISTANNGLYQFFQGLSSNSTTSTIGDSTTAAGTTDASGTATTAATTTASTGHHHHHGGGGFGKIADAVTSALQTASANGSSSTDPNQTITAALTQLFQGGASASPIAIDDAATTASGTGTPTGTTAGSAQSSGDSFEQILKANGITQQQFQADLQTALKNAQQSGSVDSTAFPAGSFVDATA